MNLKKTKVERRRWFVFAAAYVVLVCLFWKLPLFSDDFEFADLVRTKTFDEIVHYILYYGNGRLLGNTLSIVLVNSKIIVSAFVKATAVLGIIILLPRILGICSTGAFLISFLLVMGVAPQIYAQVFIWTSGFVNFTLSVFLSLLCVSLVQTASKKSIWRCMILSMVAIASQLFAEHVSIINVIVSAGMLWYYWRKDEKKRAAALTWLIASALGIVTMMLLPKIFYVAGNRTEGYREVHAGSLSAIYRSARDSIQLMIVTLSRCTLLFAVLSCFGWFVHKNAKKRYDSCARAVYVLFPLISLAFQIQEGLWIPTMIRYGAVYGGLVIYCVVLLLDILKLKDRTIKMVLLAFGLLAMMSAAPFLLVTPFGERCLLLSYIFLALFALKAVFFAMPCTETVGSGGKWILLSVAVLLSAIVCVETENIRKWDAERNEYIEACMAKGERQVCIYEIPSPYGFQTYLISRWYYYDTWDDIAFEITEYEDWLQRTPCQEE